MREQDQIRSPPACHSEEEQLWSSSTSIGTHHPSATSDRQLPSPPLAFRNMQQVMSAKTATPAVAQRRPVPQQLARAIARVPARRRAAVAVRAEGAAPASKGIEVQGPNMKALKVRGSQIAGWARVAPHRLCRCRHRQCQSAALGPPTASGQPGCWLSLLAFA